MGDEKNGRREYPDPRVIPLLTDLQGTCWWCGNVADSREHRHKRTDLRRMFDDEGVLERHKADERLMLIRSANSKSKAARFGAVLCARCNNERSQAYDRAYDTFSDYLVAHMDDFWKAGRLDMRTIFGEEWDTKVAYLARYYAKNFGCAMADNGIPPPMSLIEFMNGEARLSAVSMEIVSSEAHYWMHKKITSLESGPNSSLWRPGETTWMNPEMTKLNGYLAMSLIGYVGVRFEWHEDWSERDSFFLHLNPTIHRLRLNKRERVDLTILDSRNLINRSFRMFGKKS